MLAGGFGSATAGAFFFSAAAVLAGLVSSALGVGGVGVERFSSLSKSAFALLVTLLDAFFFGLVAGLDVNWNLGMSKSLFLSAGLAVSAAGLGDS